MTTKLPRATHEGRVTIGKWALHAFNLDNGIRLFDQPSFEAVLGFRAGEAAPKSLEKIATHPLMRSNPLATSANIFTRPIVFIAIGGKRSQGFDSEELITICRLLLKARELGILRTTQGLRYAQAAESLVVSLANVGLSALIDEATGFQRDRDRDALKALLDKYLKKELAAWAKRFPDEFYRQMFRLKGWEWRGMSINRPQVVGTYTRNIVYERLAPGIVDELERRNPKDERGERKGRHHQLLTDDIGHPALAQHLYAVLAIMRIAPNWRKFKSLLQSAFPLKGDQLELGIDD
jgi:P63C domain